METMGLVVEPAPSDGAVFNAHVSVGATDRAPFVAADKFAALYARGTVLKMDCETARGPHRSRVPSAVVADGCGQGVQVCP